MDLEKYFEMERLMQAFTFKQMQSALTVATWMGHNGVSFADLVAFLKMYPNFERLRMLGYFGPTWNLEHAKLVRELEKELDKKTRRAFRKARLNNMVHGKAPE